MTIKDETEIQKTHISSQPETEGTTAFEEDDNDKLQYDPSEQVQTEASPLEESPPKTSKLAEEVPTDPVVHREEDIFSHRKMPKTIHWSVPWSDLMMTMFILFAVLYIYQSAKREFLSREEMSSNFNLGLKSAGAITSNGMRFDDPPDIPKLYDLSKQTIKARDLNHFASVDLVADKAVRIILTGDLLFDTGKAALKPEARKKLREIAPIIRNTPYMVNVVGHTDNVPIHSALFPTNWELSVIRASVVARFFIEEMKMPAGKFYLSGHSYFQPVMPNNTAKNKATNRRVEIIITREKPYGTLVNIENIPRLSYKKGYVLSAFNS
jgi:chemotaxis protein MotB